MALQKTGDWTKVGLLIANIGKEMQQAQRESLMLWGLKAEGLALGHISAQDLGWTKLDPKYLAQKVRDGMSEDIMIRTSTYFRNITSWVVGDTVYAGVHRGLKEPSGEDVSNLAAIHEYGAGGMPERPLWQPVYAETMIWHMRSNKPQDLFMARIKKYT